MADSSDYTANEFSLQDRRRLVREGYDAVVHDYLALRLAPLGGELADVALLDELVTRVPSGALVLDAGCGAGVPVARKLQEHFRVIGVDFSQGQLALARRLVPEVTLVCQDLTNLGFANNVFDAICSYYAIIHIPREEHEPLLGRFHDLLKPGGLALLCFGSNDLHTSVEDDYFGQAMFWSHFDTATNLTLLENVGLQLVWSRLVPDGHGPDTSHLFVLVRKAAANNPSDV